MAARRPEVSSNAMRALTAQLKEAAADNVIQMPQRSRPPTEVKSRPPWQVHIDEGGADFAPTEDLSLTDMLAVLNDQRGDRGPIVPPSDRLATSLFVRERSRAKRTTSVWYASSMAE